MRALIIGYGNPLRGDDGIGPEVARLLAEQCASRDVECRTAHQLTPEIAEAMSRADIVVFIDASTENRPGEIAIVEVEPKEPTEVFSHQFDPPLLLATSQMLYNHRPRTFLVSIGASSFEFTQTLSAPVRAAIPKAIHEVTRITAITKQH